MGKVYAIDKDTVIRLDTKVNVSQAQTLQIHWERDDGTTGEWDAVIDGDTPTKIYYTKDGTEVAGDYSLMAYVEWATTGPFYGETVLLTFYDKFK